MQTYNLARLVAKRTRRSSISLPPISGSVGAQVEYLRALRAMQRALAESVRETILPQVEYEIGRQRAAMSQDAIGADIFEALKSLAVRLGLIAEATVTRILRTESERHTKKWLSSVRSALGIDIGAVVAQEDLADYLETAAARNSSLIKSLSDDTIKRVEQATYQAITQGQTVADLRKRLTEEFGVVDSRAKLIARDQVSKLNSDMNRIRHQQAGIDSYTWSTSHDERVRPRHKKLDGKEYRYGEPTGAEQGLSPGQPIQCRCVAKGIVYIDGERF